MPGPCCGPGSTRKIKIGGFDIGVVDLDNILMDVYSLGLEDDEKIKAEILKRAKGKNYISESRELHYSNALMSEYKKFVIEKKSHI